MPDQVEKATLVAYGTPQSVLKDLDIQPVVDSLTDEHAKRLRSAVDGDYHIYPKSSGLYSVESIEDGKTENTYSVNLNSNSVCSCYDYMLRCNGSGMSCKHIWRVRFLIKLGALPNKDEDPFSWIVSEIYKDLNWLEDRDLEDSEFYTKIEDLENSLTKQGRSDIDYKDIINRRANILMKATADSL